ncbi:MAG: helix-turn-helix domain-containing protein [Terriglobia bacterium]
MRRRWLSALKALLAIPPPTPIEFSDDPDPDSLHHQSSSPGHPRDHLERLRYVWLTYPGSTRELARLLDISQPHLIRLLRGDRRPSKNLRERIASLTCAF